MIESIRNHPSVVIKNCLFSVFALAVLAIMTMDEQPKISVLLIASSLVVVVIMIRAWKLTTYSFMDDRIVVKKRTAFKADRTIPYERLSSVNVVRGVFEKIFGTTILQFNVNSGVNASVPEVSICVKDDVAKRIKAYVTIHMYNHDPVSEEKVEYEYIASFSPIQVILHSILSQSTYTLLVGFFFLVYGIFSSISDVVGSKAILSSTLLLFIIQTIVPILGQIIRYFNFKVYRNEDTIYLQHGLLTNYRSSFDISRVNAFSIKKPFFARIMGMAYLETDVVGINAVSNDVTPTLCLVMKEKELDEIIKRLIPEFTYPREITKQSPGANSLIFGKSAVVAVFSTIIVALSIMISSMDTLDEFWDSNPGFEGLFVITAILTYSVLMILLILGWRLSVRNKGYSCCEDKFTFYIGVLDLEEVTIRYDCVQIIETSSGYFARRKGLSKCTISMLSSSGTKSVKSGYFRTDIFDDISFKLLTRIKDGHYFGNKNNQ